MIKRVPRVVDYVHFGIMGVQVIFDCVGVIPMLITRDSFNGGKLVTVYLLVSIIGLLIEIALPTQYKKISWWVIHICGLLISLLHPYFLVALPLFYVGMLVWTFFYYRNNVRGSLMSRNSKKNVEDIYSEWKESQKDSRESGEDR